MLFDIPAHRGALLSADYLPEQKLIMTSSNDLTINFWQADNFTLRQRLSTPEIQLCIKHVEWKINDKKVSMIYTAGSDAIIHYYDTDTLKKKGHLSGWNPFYKKDIQQYGHAGPITDLLPLKNHQVLVSAALDAKICLWDITNHTFKKELIGHDKGVYALDYYEPLDYLVSAGLDHEVFVWNPYVSERIFTLRGHNHPLIGVKNVKNTPQLITADISGMVKVWDVRNFQTMQTFNVPTEELFTFTVTYPKKRIIVGSRSLQYYEYDEPKDQELTDEKSCLCVLYNETLFSFITLHLDCLKIWEAQTGILKTVHRQISTADLTCCCLDSRKRKVFVGDSKGRIYCINIKNGARMKKLQRYKDQVTKDQVTSLVYWAPGEDNEGGPDNAKASDDSKRVIASFKSEIVRVHDDMSNDPKTIRYEMKTHLKGKAVNSLALRKKTGIIASAGDDKQVVIMNLFSYRLEGILKHDAEVKHVIFLEPHDFALTADNEGKLSFYTVPGEKGNNLNKNQFIYAMYYETQSLTSKQERFPVTAMKFNGDLGYLILGDGFGNICIWDISSLIEKLKVISNDPEKLRMIAENANNPHSAKKNAHFSETTDKRDDLFMTQPDGLDISKSDIKEIFSKKKAHDDGINHIENIPEYQAFATSSYDCKCFIWSVLDGSKLGQLRLRNGRDDLRKGDNEDIEKDKKLNEEAEKPKNPETNEELLAKYSLDALIEMLGPDEIWSRYNLEQLMSRYSVDALLKLKTMSTSTEAQKKLELLKIKEKREQERIKAEAAKQQKHEWNFKVRQKERDEENRKEAEEMLKALAKKKTEKELLARQPQPQAEAKKKKKEDTSITRKVLDMQMSKEFGEADDQQHETLRDEEDFARNSKSQIARLHAERALDLHRQMKRGAVEQLDPDKDLYVEDEDEDEDYHILHDLDFKTNTNYGVNNKNIFKSKSIKTFAKAKLK